MKLGISEVFQFLSLVSPFILTMMMVLISLFNSDVKGLVYLAGIMLALPINVMLQNLIKSKCSREFITHSGTSQFTYIRMREESWIQSGFADLLRLSGFSGM